MPILKKITAREILDSRGRPTLSATCELASGARSAASVPSGASTGAGEALELRDGDAGRYEGLGCRKAVAHVNEEIQRSLGGRSFESQTELDRSLIALDGSLNKSRLGANAILGVSLAFARASAVEENLPLYQYFTNFLGLAEARLPRLTVNLFSGGKHAGNQVPIQDVLLCPLSATTIDEGLAMVYTIYQTAAREILKRYGMRLLRADEGGLAPPCRSIDEMLTLANDCIWIAGYQVGSDVALAVDVASSQFYANGAYDLGVEQLSSPEMIDRLESWIDTYHVTSLEDGLAEEDWQHWPQLNARIGSRCLVLGDDFLCTNPERIRCAGEARAANALLLKVNQIGTLTEAAEACRLARTFGWKVTVSARSGETEDNWLADLAVGWQADQIKIGSITQSERLVKYNRLLEIEQDWSKPI
ncbi:MAG: phosphopyruvate hydratase [Chthonomonadaceae bacterium]|nr:phosphopyruvate hydratase [Chthonomonadaceae bacterium]